MPDETNNRVVHSSFWSNLFKGPSDKSDLEIALAAIPIFTHLNKKDISLLLNIIHNRNYISGEYIFYQGDPGIGLYLIREGEVIIQRSSENSELISLATFRKGDFFGELAMVDGEKRSASAVAKADTRLAVIFKPDLDDFIEKYPKKGVKILQGICEIVATRLRILNEDHFNLQKQGQIKSESNYGTEY